MRVPAALLAVLVALSLPTTVWLVLHGVGFLRIARDAVVALRWWPRCRVVFEPPDDPTYRERCVRGWGHERHEHYDGTYLFRDATHEFWADGVLGGE